MCRLMGYVANDATTLSQIAGPEFVEFTALSAKHGDGWGIASDSHAASPDLLVEPTRAKESATYSKAVSSITSNAALLHLRWATLGLPVTEGNTHPFVSGNISFIHNGGIKPPTSLDSGIDPEYLTQLRGDTDSESYFYYLLTHINKSNLKDGVVSGVRAICNGLEYSSINAMMMTPEFLVIICEHNNNKIPEDEGPDYYELFYRKDERGVLIASTGWTQEGWQNLPNHHVMFVDRKTHNVEVIAL